MGCVCVNRVKKVLREYECAGWAARLAVHLLALAKFVPPMEQTGSGHQPGSVRLEQTSAMHEQPLTTQKRPAQEAVYRRRDLRRRPALQLNRQRTVPATETLEELLDSYRNFLSRVSNLWNHGSHSLVRPPDGGRHYITTYLRVTQSPPYISPIPSIRSWPGLILNGIRRADFLSSPSTKTTSHEPGN
jgi:hypothetical protein